MLVVPGVWRKKLEKAGYAIYNHSAVQICHWTRKSILDQGDCYKHRFYGIDTWGCMQISQSVMWCTNRCIYCWRPNEEFAEFFETLPEDQVDDPKTSLEALRTLRRNLLIGYKGNPEANKEKLEKTLEHPSHVTFSLSGEPLLYPFVPESIKYIKENWPWVRSIFVVTNGLVPNALEKMQKTNSYPTQLYISFVAPEPELYKKISRTLLKDFWDRFLRSLELASRLKVRRVARITLIKGLNDDPKHFNAWKKLIELFNPHFVEVKAFMLLGYSRYRLSTENMPSHEYIKEWARKLEEKLDNFVYWDEHPPSRVVLLKNVEKGFNIDPRINNVEPNV